MQSWPQTHPAPKGVMAQRTGPVTITDDYDDGDMTMLSVPQEAVGFVTGRAGNFLRTIEEEPTWNDLGVVRWSCARVGVGFDAIAPL